MVEGRTPDGFIRRDGLVISPLGVGGIPSDDGSTVEMEIQRAHGNDDLLIRLSDPNSPIYLYGIRFQSPFGGGDSHFVDSEISALQTKFNGRQPKSVAKELEEEDFVYSHNPVSLEIGAPESPYEFKIKDLQGMEDYGQYEHMLLDIEVNRDGSVAVTLKNDRNYREDEVPDPESAGRSLSMTFRPDGEFPIMNQAFKAIAQRAKAAVEKRDAPPRRRPKRKR